MKKKVIFVSLTLVLLLSVFIGLKVKMENNRYDSVDTINKNDNMQHMYSKEYVEPIVVSLETHKNLFDSIENVKEWDNRVPGKSIIEVEVVFKEENDTNIKKIYDINDKQLREDYMLRTVSSINYGMAGYENEGVKILFDNTKIDRKYKLIIPDEYKGRKVRDVSFVNNENDSNLVEIVYPDSCRTINIKGCYNLEKVSFDNKVINVYINNCNKLTCIPNITNENYLRIGSSYNSIAVEQVVIPDSVLLISYSFCNLEQISDINIGRNIKILMDSFNNCPKVGKVDIPDNISVIWNSFMNCKNITLIVGKGTVGEKYAQDNNINYEYRQ